MLLLSWAAADQSQLLLQELIAQSQSAGDCGDVSKEDAGGEEKALTVVLKASHMSLVDASHTTVVTDLTWLPNMSFTRDGRPPTATKVALNFFPALTAA